ncbi:low temperature requirement protein A [Acetobacter oeni]|uniref:low temperature requirement protein A n=1 Tax=Acetobacter oeni TaxID=304077 RepID=UPI0011BE5777|nr:low temperature requirement protein A [Acetobacter oeni]MBB3883427.1 low temperature requirement protein LtrA [Acetobacter oeni]NHO19399.1 hypothetical protein [Acetobacter oeni]
MSRDKIGFHPLLRRRDGGHAPVTNEELFFDLVYVFAITQISHGLLHHLTLMGVLQTAVLWFAAWLGWQYAAWVTNWFDPRTPAIRGLIFSTMALALLVGAAVPEAWGERGLAFALCYVGMQAGRSAFIVWQLPSSHPLAPNYRRILGWVSIAGCFWIAGGLVSPVWRLPFWIVAVLCEYISPMFGFALPGLGRSRTRDWTIDGAHLVERCQLFTIVALGETIMASGLSMAERELWTPPALLAFLVSFLCSIAMWWLYFGTSLKEAEHAITRSDDTGRMGAYFHYIHAVLISGIIITAVGTDLLLENPMEHAEGSHAAVMIGGPVIYLLGTAVYKRVAGGRFPWSHVSGAAAVLAVGFAGRFLPMLALAGLVTLALLLVGAGEKAGPERGLV